MLRGNLLDVVIRFNWEDSDSIYWVRDYNRGYKVGDKMVELSWEYVNIELFVGNLYGVV